MKVVILKPHRDDMLVELIKYGGLTAVVASCVSISWIDYHQHRIPNRLTGPLAAGTVLWLLLLGALTSELGSAVKAIAVGLAMAVGLLAINFATNAIGMGDVKLVAPVAATVTWLGRNPSITTMVVIAAAALLVSGAAIAKGHGLRHQVPLAPIITVGLIGGALAHGIGQ